MHSTKCVVCEAAADVYCHNDDASLCFSCDAQVHSANPLASRHHRVPIANATSEASDSLDNGLVVPSALDDGRERMEPVQVASKGDDGELSFDDDVLFTVPDISSTGPAREGAPAFQTSTVPGKDFLSDDMDLFDLDSCWLDRLDVGLDRLPSDILDSLVPEVPSTVKPAGDEPRTMPADHSAGAPSANGGQATTVQRQAAPAAEQMVTYVHAQPMMHAVAFQPQASQTIALSFDGAEGPIDINNYVPRSLLPMDPAMRVQLMHGRREKLARFREKKANRHFKKTIRYASRKAYAEVRPRIKGRFARKDEVAAMRAAGILPVA